jgi:formylglycine-generating enzyme required for sulfatase activity
MASRPPKPPDAFLSYTRWDDQRDRGKISQFRQELAAEVRTVTGEPFEIFQDVDDIGVGERWSDKLDQMLDEARFFIPILTPNYFRSEACRDELGRFLNEEKAKGRGDLVLPIYYIECDVLEDAELRTIDPLATEIHKRQHHDWRKLRHSPFSTRAVKTALHDLARAIGRARRRPILPQATRQASSTMAFGTEVARAPAPQHAQEPSRRAAVLLTPGTVFRDIDAPWCPEMVVIPPGEFMMGSSEAERQWGVEQGVPWGLVEWEKLQHLVRIAYLLAVGRYPVTFDEYDHFARTTGRAQPNDQGWGRGRRPVINVDWDDAKAFAAWLSVRTGQPYRLLSEAEWEYACRAGSTTRYSWGDEITPEKANYWGKVEGNLGRTSEVGEYPANPFGLYDMHGNVCEWGEDCWNDSYEGAPDDGSAWTTGACSGRVLRGGSWCSRPGYLRSACRFINASVHRKDHFGFRVARALSHSESVSS